MFNSSICSSVCVDYGIYRAAVIIKTQQMWTRRRAGNILTVEREDFSLINQNDLSIRFRIEHNIYLVLGRHTHSGETKQSGAGAGAGCEW